MTSPNLPDEERKKIWSYTITPVIGGFTMTTYSHLHHAGSLGPLHVCKNLEELTEWIEKQETLREKAMRASAKPKGGKKKC